MNDDNAIIFNKISEFVEIQNKIWEKILDNTKHYIVKTFNELLSSIMFEKKTKENENILSKLQDMIYIFGDQNLIIDKNQISSLNKKLNNLPKDPIKLKEEKLEDNNLYDKILP